MSQHKTKASELAKRGGGYARQPNDLITAREAVLLIDNRVAVLIAHWEAERRKRTWYRRLWRLVTRRTGR